MHPVAEMPLVELAKVGGDDKMHVRRHHGVSCVGADFTCKARMAAAGTLRLARKEAPAWHAYAGHAHEPGHL